MKSEENKAEKPNPNQENIFHDGGTLSHYLGNDDYKDGNRENDEDEKKQSKDIGRIALGNEEIRPGHDLQAHDS